MPKYLTFAAKTDITFNEDWLNKHNDKDKLAGNYRASGDIIWHELPDVALAFAIIALIALPLVVLRRKSK